MRIPFRHASLRARQNCRKNCHAVVESCPLLLAPQIQVESFPCLANTSCASLVSRLFLCRSAAISPEIRPTADTCNARGVRGNARGAQFHWLAGSVLAPPTPWALLPTRDPARAKRPLPTRQGATEESSPVRARRRSRRRLR